MGKLDPKTMKALITAVCVTMPDAQVLAIAKAATMKSGGHAARHLEHYLSGGGKTLPVDLKRLMREDKKLASFVAGEITKSLTKGKKKGTILVIQKRYGNKDWWFAIGGMNLDWQLKKKGIAQISLRNKYRWHPNKKLISQCVHEAAERLKKSAKAEDYWMVGAPAPFDVKAMSGSGSKAPPPAIFEL